MGGVQQEVKDPMSDQQFSPITRYAFFYGHNKRCGACNALILGDDFQIDHILPERLISAHDERNRLLDELKLSRDFDLRSDLNLLPVHISCNLRKGGRTLTTRGISILLEWAHQMAPKVQEHRVFARSIMKQEIALLKQRITSAVTARAVPVLLAENVSDTRLSLRMKQAVRLNFDGACALTGERMPEILMQFTMIKALHEGGLFTLKNLLFVTPNAHMAYDMGLIIIDPTTYIVEIAGDAHVARSAMPSKLLRRPLGGDSGPIIYPEFL